MKRRTVPRRSCCNHIWRRELAQRKHEQERQSTPGQDPKRTKKQQNGSDLDFVAVFEHLQLGDVAWNRSEREKIKAQAARLRAIRD
jgi:hypothetical protein